MCNIVGENANVKVDFLKKVVFLVISVKCLVSISKVFPKYISPVLFVLCFITITYRRSNSTFPFPNLNFLPKKKKKKLMEGSGFFFQRGQKHFKILSFDIIIFQKQKVKHEHTIIIILWERIVLFITWRIFWYLWRHWCKRNSFLVRITTPFTLCVTKSTKFLNTLLLTVRVLTKPQMGDDSIEIPFYYSVQNLNFILANFFRPKCNI